MEKRLESRDYVTIYTIMLLCESNNKSISSRAVFEEMKDNRYKSMLPKSTNVVGQYLSRNKNLFKKNNGEFKIKDSIYKKLDTEWFKKYSEKIKKKLYIEVAELKIMELI